MLKLDERVPTNGMNHQGFVNSLSSIEITLGLDGQDCDVKVDGKPLPNRGPYAFRIKSTHNTPTVVEVESFVEKDGELVQINKEFVMAVDQFLTPKLVINGVTIFDEPREKVRKYEDAT